VVVNVNYIDELNVPSSPAVISLIHEYSSSRRLQSTYHFRFRVHNCGLSSRKVCRLRRHDI